MTERELRYLRPGEILPLGWSLGPSLEGCYHGQFATHIIVREIMLPAPDACPFCGTFPYASEQIHGHYTTNCCHQIIDGCCVGS